VQIYKNRNRARLPGREPMSLTEELIASRILIVDDNEINVQLLEAVITGAGYTEVISITDSRRAEDLYRTYRPDLVLLDLNMPYCDGFQVLEQFHRIEGSSYLPVLVLTAMQDNETKLKALGYGAQDFLTKPFNRLEILTRIKNILTVRLLHQQIQRQNLELEEKVRERTREIEETRMEIIRRLGRAAEYRDNETGLHIIRMSKVCARLGELAGLDREAVELLLATSPMHDIGKIAIPDAILLKPGPLTDAEWERMTHHPSIGCKLLDGHESVLMRSAREIALTHHEKWNGKGYPQGLKGEAIPLSGRLAGLADVFDALTSRRPYKEPFSVEKAMAIIGSEREKHFDPELTDLFLQNIDDFVAIKEDFPE
jgi:putative two-component system response regulator